MDLPLCPSLSTDGQIPICDSYIANALVSVDMMFIMKYCLLFSVESTDSSYNDSEKV